MIVKISFFLVVFVMELYASDRPSLKVENGNIYLEGAAIYLKTFDSSSGIFINDINVNSKLSDLSKPDDGSFNNIGSMNNLINNLKSRVERLEDIVIKSNITDLDRVNTTTIKPKSKIGTLSRRVQALETLLNSLLQNDACRSSPCRNSGKCQILLNDYFCQCSENWEGKNCDEDVNECRRFAGTDLGCQNGAQCINKPGTYECQCQTGWFGVHCTRREQDCTAGDREMCGHGTCIATTTGIGYKCLCEQGWTTNGLNPQCIVDVDECKQVGQAKCSLNPKVECINMPGSFRCGPCPTGYTGDGYECYDVNECLTNNGGCSVNPLVRCENIVGSRRCLGCPPGFQGDGITCSLKGSCLVNNGGCHPSAKCFEGGDNVECVCPVGMLGDGFGVAGCFMSNVSAGVNCSGRPCIHGDCIDLTNGYTCLCKPGYTGAYCDVVDNACTKNKCQNGATCMISDASVRGYICICPLHYSGRNCEQHNSICGEHISLPEGNITVPESNRTQSWNIRCAFVIETEPNKILNIVFTKFNLENSSDCSKDFLQIHDGRGTTSPLIGRYCGEQLPNNGTIISTHNVLYFWYRTDHNIQSEGFSFRWNSSNPVCGGLYNIETHGTLSSPGAPGKYPRNRQCIWILKAPMHKQINIQFFLLDMPSGEDCKNSSLTVHWDHMIKNFCNNTLPKPILTTSSEVILEFSSDTVHSPGNGFQLTYSTVEGIPNCNLIYTGVSGEITTASLEHYGRQSLECSYVIKVDKGLKIKLVPIHFPGLFLCNNNSLTVYDADTILVGRYCRTMPKEIMSSDNSLLIKLEIHYSVGLEPFKFAYSAVCQKEYHELNGIIRSPEFSETHIRDITCHYYVLLPPLYSIALNFMEFNLRRFLSTTFEVHDGSDDSSPLLYSYNVANYETPQSYITKYNHLYIKHRIRPGSVFKKYAFVANYSSIRISCGGIYREPSANISYVRLERNKSCSWILSAPKNQIVELVWSAFRVPGDCNNIYVTVADLDDETPPHKFCGNTPPPTMLSRTNNVIVNMVTSGYGLIMLFFSYKFIDAENECGGKYLSTSGIITSPGWPKKYPRDKDCTWIISAPALQLITLNVTYFNIEQKLYALKCDEADYVEIRDGSTPNSPLIGKYCTSIPKILKSTGHNMYIHFHSNSFHFGSGFKIEWDSRTKGCGGTLTKFSGTITSPNYPGKYKENSECYWNIIVPPGSWIMLNFHDISLETALESSGCMFDYIAIYEGSNDSGKLIGRYCKLTSETRFISTQTNNVFIKFVSDFTFNEKGFSLDYTTQCNTQLSGLYGVIQSPYFMSDILGNLNCTWHINVLSGGRIRILFSHFLLSKVQWQCSNTYVELADSSVTQRYCLEQPKIFMTSSNHVAIKYIAKSHILDSPVFKNRGFRLEWTFEGCGGILKSSSGVLSLPDKRKPGKLECEWHIQVSDDLIGGVALKITNLVVKSSTNCTYEYLRVYNGIDDESPQLLNLCHGLENGVYEASSSASSMMVKFSSSYSLMALRAEYRTTYRMCGGRVTSGSGFIMSPNYPKNYIPNANCHWIIKVPSNHLIKLEFVELDLDNDGHCSDYVSIHETGVPWITPTMKLCGSSKLNMTKYDYLSRTNSIRIKFSSNEKYQAKGFKLHYYMTCGANIVTEGEGYISNDAHTESHYNDSCIWTIQAKDPAEKIYLTVTHIDIPHFKGRTNVAVCNMNNLTIYDGDTTNSSVRGTYCGKVSPKSMMSVGSAFTIQYNIYKVSNVEFRPGTFTIKYSVTSVACGGDMMSKDGVISSPGYPETYNINVDCIWTLAPSPGNKVTLMLDDLQLESSDECNKDYLEIRRDTEIGPVLALYCGSDMKNISLESMHNLYIKFHSDNDTTNLGFMLTYSYETVYEIVNKTKGEVSSLMYPKYTSNGFYEWMVRTQDYTLIMITIKTLDIENEGGCQLNYLKIYDGDETHPLLKTLCGNDDPSDMTIETTSNIAKIEFNVVNVHLGSRFLLEFLEISYQQGNKTVSICGVQSTTYIPPNTNITILSPNYPLSYPIDLKCEWMFNTLPGYHLELQFEQFQLEEIPTCFADFVKVFTRKPERSWEAVTDELCLSNTTKMTIATSELMKVAFKSDVTVNEKGYKGYIYSRCGGYLKNTSGLIEANYNKSITCEWIVKAKPGRTIAFNIEKLNMGWSSLFCKNYLKIYNGYANDSAILVKYCDSNNVNTSTIQTTGSTLHVTFKTAESLNPSYMRLHYEEVNVECGLTSMLDDVKTYEVISTPNYPNVPLPYTECNWIIMAPPGNILTINFTERFDVGSFGCMDEYLEIRDGSTEVAPRIGKYCFIKPTNDIITTDNTMFIKYYTSVSEPRNGFKAVVSIYKCGGVIKRGEGTLLSPGYPLYKALPSGTVCKWQINSPKPINLYIIDIKLPRNNYNSDKCNSKLVIENAGEAKWLNDTSRVYCYHNSTSAKEIKLFSNKLTVSFYYDQAFVGGEPYKFRIDFNSSSACFHTLKNVFGTIEHDEPLTSFACEWDVEIPDKNKRIKLEFTDVTLQNTILSITSGYNELSSIRYYSMIQSNVTKKDWVGYTSSNRFRMMIYRQDRSSAAYAKFKLKYTSEPTVCSQKLEGNSGRLTTPAVDDKDYKCFIKNDNSDNINNVGTTILNITMSVNPISRCPLIKHVIDVYNNGERGTPGISKFPENSQIAHCFISDFLAKSLCESVEKSIIIIPDRVFYIDIVSEPDYNLTYSIDWKIEERCGGNIVPRLNKEPIISIQNETTGPIICAYAVKVDRVINEISFEGNFTWDCDTEYITIDINFKELARYCAGNPVSPMSIHYSRRTINVIYINKKSYSNKTTANVYFKRDNNYDKVCGGELKSESYIKSPNYPKSYNSSLDCEWIIKTFQRGNRINLQFTNRFNIESSKNCTKDYLKLYDWLNGDYVEKGRLCGRETPTSFKSSGEQMKILFHSDENINADGFKVTWKEECGGYMLASDKIQHFKPPLHYKWSFFSVKTNCTYIIDTPHNEKVLLNFKGRTIEEALDCREDYIVVRDGANVSNVYCPNEEIPASVYISPVNIIYNEARIPTLLTVQYKIEYCGGIVEKPSVIQSQSDELETYLGESDCLWNITAPPGKVIVLKFLLLDLEIFCEFDSVNVIDGVSLNDTSLAELCGTHHANLPTIRSSSNHMLVHFTSDNSNNQKGFKAVVHFTLDEAHGCGGTIMLNTSLSHTIRTPTMSNGNYHPGLDCQWIVVAPDDNVVTVQFNVFNLGDCRNTTLSNSCPCGFVELKDENAMEAVVIDRYCGDEIPPSITSSLQLMMVRFVSDLTHTGRGFEATFTRQPSSCEKTYYELKENETIVLETPGYKDKNITRGLHCKYVIKSTDAFNIKFTNIDLEPASLIDNTCHLDKLIIYTENNLPLDDYEIVFHDNKNEPNEAVILCGSHTNYEYVSYRNGETIVNIKIFTSDNEARHAGFRLETTPRFSCDSNLTDPYGLIYKRMEDNNKTCSVLITTDANKTISLYTLHNDGVDGKIQIYDGNSSHSKLLDEYYQIEQLHSVHSTGRYMLLVYNMTYANHQANYITTDKGSGCGGYLFHNFGEVTSPFFPESYKKNTVCEWILETPQHTKLHLEFKDFYIGPRTQCDQTYIQLMNRKNEIVNTYCADDQIGPYISEDNFVKIVFKSILNSSGNGWRAIFYSRLSNEFNDYPTDIYT